MLNELRLCTGRGSIDLRNPVPADVDMRDVCTNLSRIRRWNGAVDFTVDQHSRLVEAILRGKSCSAVTCLAGLLHDAHEYVTGDIAEPVLKMLHIENLCVNFTMQEIQDSIQNAINIKTGFHTSELRIYDVDFDAIHAADTEARACEVWWMLPESPMLDELKARYQEPSKDARAAALLLLYSDYSDFAEHLAAHNIEVEP